MIGTVGRLLFVFVGGWLCFSLNVAAKPVAQDVSYFKDEFSGVKENSKGFDIYFETTDGIVNVLRGVSIRNVTDFTGEHFLVVERRIDEKVIQAYLDLDRVRAIIPQEGFVLGTIE